MEAIITALWIIAAISFLSLWLIRYAFIIPFLRERNLIPFWSGLLSWTVVKELQLYRDWIKIEGLPQTWLKINDMIGKIFGVSALLFLVLSLVYGLMKL